MEAAMAGLQVIPSGFCLISLLITTYLYRCLHYYRFEQLAQWPQPKPSIIFGHMKVVHKALQKYGSANRTDAAFRSIYEELGKPPAFILDLRPMGPVMCIVCNHLVAEQCVLPTKEFPYGMDKSPTLKAFSNLIGKGSILTSNGPQWRELRKTYSPGFAFQHLLQLLPGILESTCDFMTVLDDYAKSVTEFRLGDITASVTYDIIFRVIMGISLTSQPNKTYQDEIRQLYEELVATYRNAQDVQLLNDPRVKWRRQRLSAEIDALIKRCIKVVFESPPREKKEFNSVVSLGLKSTDKLTPEILQLTCDQVKTFLFAGQDTTSTILQWAIYELSRTPHALLALRTELDKIFGNGNDIGIMRQALISDGANIMGKMPYTSAVLKETLRLHPPGATARMVAPGSGMHIQLPGGPRMCIDGLNVYNCLSIIQRDIYVYGETNDEFRPERWLSITPDTPPSAWRPFERGHRNCIGQELANIEARVILACIVRRYNFSKVGLGEIKYSESGDPVMDEKGQYKVVSEVYDVREVTFKPADGMRMRVSLAA